MTALPEAWTISIINVPVKNLIDYNFLDFDKYQNYWYNSTICRSADGGFYALLN